MIELSEEHRKRSARTILEKVLKYASESRLSTDSFLFEELMTWMFRDCPIEGSEGILTTPTARMMAALVSAVQLLQLSSIRNVEIKEGIENACNAGNEESSGSPIG